eukprot:5882175-Pleurochrysis_carterae.AAC.1
MTPMHQRKPERRDARHLRRSRQGGHFVCRHAARDAPIHAMGCLHACVSVVKSERKRGFLASKRSSHSACTQDACVLSWRNEVVLSRVFVKGSAGRFARDRAHVHVRNA